MIKKYTIEAFQKFFLLNEIATLKSKWKSNRRSKAFKRGFNWVFESYFLDNMSLEDISNNIELGKYSDINDMIFHY